MYKSQQRKQQPKRKEEIIEFTNQYPFNVYNNYPAQTVVKFTKKFLPQEYQAMIKKISMHSKLKHQSLISIIKAFQSKKNKYFDIFYQFIPYDLTFKFSTLQKSQIQQNKNRLIDLSSYLISKNWNPIISVGCLGIDQKGILKYFLHFDTNHIIQQKKNELFNRKKYQINQIFLQLANQPNINYIFSQPSIRIEGNNTSRSQDPTQYKIHFRYHSPTNRNSSLTQSKSISQERSLLSKMQNIDNRLKQLGGRNGLRQNPIFHSTKPSQQVQPYFLNDNMNNKTQIQESYRANNLSSYPDQQVYNKKNIFLTVQNDNNYQLQYNQPVRQSYNNKVVYKQNNSNMYKNYNSNGFIQNPYNNYKSKRFDQQSIDTYQQQLGQVVEMPKMMPHTEMRQTTNSPPKQFQAEKKRDKLHQSVGFGQFRILGSQDARRGHNKSTNNLNGQYKQGVYVQHTKKNKINKDSYNIKDSKKQESNNEQLNFNKKIRKIVKSQNKIQNSNSKQINASIKKVNKIQNVKINNQKFFQQFQPAKTQKQKINSQNKIQNNNNKHYRQDNQQIQQDFTNLKSKSPKNKRISNTQNQQLKKQTSFVDQERSREYLYRYQNIFPDCGVQEKEDQDTSVQNAASLQNHLNQLYNQSLKFQNNDALVSQFNTLFQCAATPTSSNSKKQLVNNSINNNIPNQRGPLKETNSPQRVATRSKQINERVKLALQKSQATLQYFSKLKIINKID